MSIWSPPGKISMSRLKTQQSITGLYSDELCASQIKCYLLLLHLVFMLVEYMLFDSIVVMTIEIVENDYTGATLTETRPVIFITLRRSEMSDYLPAPLMSHYCQQLTRLDG